uniref:Putative pdz domain-containing protein n=1 Tax=Nyssomyia neivai TaxID=330878 RepID=A0A1L8DWD5_9DIPT
MFDLPPKCPALASKLSGIFGWRHTYRVQQKHKDLNHLRKSYSLNIPRKVIVEDPHSWVVVHHLQSQSGILDPDDCVSDVADDREQILASFDDCPEPNVPKGGGDGASGSSVGTGSPDIFRGVNGGNLKRVYPEDAQVTDLAKYSDNVSTGSRSHIEVTDSVSPLGLGLQVRRSSDPSIPQTIVQECTQRSPLCQCPTHEQQDAMKRWSAAPVCRRDTDSPAERILANVVNNSANYLAPPTAQWPDPPGVEATETHGTSPGTSFSRSGRLSMQFLGESAPGYRWMEAAEKVAANMNQGASFNSKSLPRDLKRKEPLGQAYESMRDKRDTELLLVINEKGGGPLGLTAFPDHLNGGLLVQSVEPGSRAERGRLQKGDRILEINGTKLAGMSEANLQSYLKKSLSAAELRFRVSTVNRTAAARDDTKVATVSPNRKTAGTPATNSLQAANTRKLGRRIEIALKKGGHGLGFSVTTRDNPTGGHCPIYIKNILPRGAAIESGKLKPGDRLLEVDGIAMTGKTQSEVVGILRATQLGATVKIIVSRQSDLEEIDEREVKYDVDKENAEGTPPKPPPPVLPQKPQKSPSVKSLGHSEGKNSLNSTNSSSADSSAGTLSWKNREIVTLHIPVHDTERAGLGVSVKGKTGSSGSFNRQTDGDLGIFVKSVLHGGAASRDGRLKMNDQLLSVNGVSLLGQSNADAMETLRRAMLHTGGKFPGVITLSVARKIARPSSMGDLLEATAAGPSDRANATVIYLNCEPQKGRKEENTVEMWNNPVVDRITGGVEIKQPMTSSPYVVPGLRNESYYMATKDPAWSPLGVNSNHINNRNNSILIEEDSEPTSPTLPNRPQYQSMVSADSNATLTSGDVTYSSQLSLEPPTGEAFSRDAIGRRSISEKHHAALDAKETGTYQRNKKLREDRERERRAAMAATGSVDSLGKMGTKGSNVHASEALDRVTDLGPSLGLKKSSSLESLQTMVHEIQMADEPRGPVALRTPRGRGREEILRAAVECPPENESRKQWLLDYDGPAINRNSPLQSSVSSGKQKRSGSGKKSSLLKGIGHMFRFGKHRKDGIAPAETMSALDQRHVAQQKRELPPKPYGERPLGGPPGYQPPPAPIADTSTVNNDHFFQRYRPGFKYDDHQEQLSRSHQQYQSQRSTRTVNAYPVRQNSSRPISSYYEYETLQFPADSRSECGWKGGAGVPVAGRGRQWNGVGGSTRSRGPFVTQVTIRQPHHAKQNSQPSSKV